MLILLYPLYGVLAQFINVDSVFVIILAAIIVVFTYLSSITSSLFQSMKMFLSLGIISFSYPFLRFVLTYPLIKVWNGYIGATASMVIAIMLSFILTSLITRLSSNFEEYKGELKFDLAQFVSLVPIVVMNVLYSVLNYADLLFVRRYFEEAQTDMFAIASTIAKATLFVIIPVSYVVLPRMIDDYHKRGYRAGVNALMKGIALSFFACLVYLGIIAVFSDIILMIFGYRYLEAKPLVFPFTLAFIPMGLSFLLINYSVTFRNWALVIPLVIANIGLVGGFIIWHSNFYQMILVYGVVGTFLLISSILFVIFSKKPKVSDEEVNKELEEMSPSSYQ
jgi:O-antigen/teichoic acid export membrane protein